MMYHRAKIVWRQKFPQSGRAVPAGNLWLSDPADSRQTDECRTKREHALFFEHI